MALGYLWKEPIAVNPGVGEWPRLPDGSGLYAGRAGRATAGSRAEETELSWNVVDRTHVDPEHMGPGLSDGVREKIRGFFPRYPSKRAALIPALHILQDDIGYCSLRAMREVAELLEITPAQVMDVVSFYTHFWTHPRGKKVLMLCRSISCQLLGADKLEAAIKSKLNVGEHETTPDGRFSFMTEECLAACDFAPCMMVNEKMHKCVKVEDLDRILSDANSDRLDLPRSDLFDSPRGPHGK